MNNQKYKKLVRENIILMIKRYRAINKKEKGEKFKNIVATHWDLKIGNQIYYYTITTIIFRSPFRLTYFVSTYSIHLNKQIEVTGDLYLKGINLKHL